VPATRTRPRTTADEPDLALDRRHHPRAFEDLVEQQPAMRQVGPIVSVRWSLKSVRSRRPILRASSSRVPSGSASAATASGSPTFTSTERPCTSTASTRRSRPRGPVLRRQHADPRAVTLWRAAPEDRYRDERHRRAAAFRDARDHGLELGHVAGHEPPQQPAANRAHAEKSGRAGIVRQRPALAQAQILEHQAI